MKPNFKERLIDYGFEIDKTLERFMGNEDLYEKFLKRFLEDESMENFKMYYEEEDMDKAFFSAHTLKGVAANLGITPILIPLEPLVEKLRAGESGEEVKEYFEKLKEEYEKVKVIIEEEL